MTAINDLVEEAGSLGMGAWLQALCDVARALEDMLSPEVSRIEFRMPAEPMDVKEAPEAISVSQVDVYALAREMAGVLRELVVPDKEPAAPAAVPIKADAPATPAVLSVSTVTRELRERLERLEKETISLPAVCSDLYAGKALVSPVDRPFAGDHALMGGRPSGDRAVPQPPVSVPQPPVSVPQPSVPYKAMPSVEGSIVEKRAEREVFEKTFKKSSVESTEESIKRSSSVVRELENVYERLASSTIDVDREIRRSAVVELDSARVQAGAAVPPPEKGASPEVTPPPALLRSVEVPPFRLKPLASPPSEQAADNVKRLSGAMARSGGPAPAEMPAQVEMPVKLPAVPPSIAPQPVVVTPPALVAVHHSFNVMNRYLSSAAGMAGVTSHIAEGAVSAPGGQAPLVRLMVDRAAPASTPINMLVQAGGSVMAPVPQPMLIEGGGGSPAPRLAVNIAAAPAMEHPGGQAILNLARDTGYGRIPGETVKINLHGANPSATDNNTTHKVSNFHNTFNITVTVKGGGAEEGDLRELGKKIGRILSEEIKRYGGI